MLKLTFLGSPQISLDGQSPTGAISGKTLALLAYLSTTGGTHRRDKLARLLWHGMSDSQARKNLRDTLPFLRKLLGNHLIITRNEISFNRDSPYWLDVEAFQNHVLSASSQNTPKLLESVLELYQGHFLDGFYVRNAPAFEDWVFLQREQLHACAVQGFQRLTDLYVAQEEYTAGLTANGRVLELEPWCEQAHCQRMKLLAHCGQRSAALAQFAICKRTLADELAVEPDAETVALYEQIRTGEFYTLSAAEEDRVLQPNAPHRHGVELDQGPTVADESASPLPSRKHSWTELPATTDFCGRQDELAQLTDWILHEQCRLVAIFGIGGQGKTALAAAFVRTLVESTHSEQRLDFNGTFFVDGAALHLRPFAPFDHIIWSTLSNAPPLAQIIPNWLQQISNQQDLPNTLDDQLAMLLDCLRRKRCLLILDGLEHIMHSNGCAGRYKAGYAPYGELLRHIDGYVHQSCLLLTSREQPMDFHRLRSPTATTRTLHIAGLPSTAGLDILRKHGLTDNSTALEKLIRRYSGNPLALMLVAQTVHELFNGDVDAFLREQTLIFDDIRDVLDQQFRRLSTVERDILVWLAVEGNPITFESLYHSLVPAPSRRAYLAAQRSLLRRSLVEKHDDKTQLPHIVMEYVRSYLIEAIADELLHDKLAEWLEERTTVSANVRVPTGVNVPTLSSRQGPRATAGAIAVHPILLSNLNRYPLMKAQSREPIRASQVRLFLQPLADRLRAVWGVAGVKQRLKSLLQVLRRTAPRAPGYAAANILHLLLYLKIEICDVDFSQLTIWQADLHNARLPQINLANTDLCSSLFAESVDTPRGGQRAASSSDCDCPFIRRPIVLCIPA